MSVNLQALLTKAISAIPAKSPVRAEIEKALADRAIGRERALKAWETMRANKAAAQAAADLAAGIKPAKAKPVAKAKTKTGPAPKTAPKRSKAQAEARA